MDTLHARCAGLDVHKRTVVACRRVGSGANLRQEVRTFATTTRGLMELSDWLREVECTIVAMEATGPYWKPVWHVLEGDFELVLANAAHIHNVPGRKSDVNDATWIAQLLACGLIRSSFVPPPVIQELRDLTRTRRQLLREVVQHTQRVQRILEDCNIKLDSVISNVLGLSGRAMLDAIVAGETDPKRLAALGNHRLKCSRESLEEALHGRVRPHHRFLLRQHLRMIDSLGEVVRECEGQIESTLEPFQAEAAILMTMPGISIASSRVILAEIGTDMTRFPTAAHLVSWAGLCPRMDESAGKRRSTRIRKSSQWLKPVLVQCGWAASRTDGTYLQSLFRRIRSRGGSKKAAVAVAASMLTAIYYMLRDGVAYQDLGPDHFVQRDRTRIAQHLTRRLRDLGYEVTIQEAA